MGMSKYLGKKAQRGAAMVEYALLLGSVSLIMILGFSVLGHKTNDISSLLAVILPGAHSDEDNLLRSGALLETTSDAGEDGIAGTEDDVFVFDNSRVGGGDSERLLVNARLNTNTGTVGQTGNDADNYLPE